MKKCTSVVLFLVQGKEKIEQTRLLMIGRPTIMNNPPVQQPPLNQYETPCTVDEYEGEQHRGTERFSDLQMAYLYIQEQMQGLELHAHRNEFLHSFQQVIAFLEQHPRDFVVVARSSNTWFKVYYSLN